MKFSLIFIVGIFGIAFCANLNSNCTQVCRKIYDPYCLTYEDGTKATFSNNCVLEIEICMNGLNSKGEPLLGAKGACEDEYYFDKVADQINNWFTRKKWSKRFTDII